MSKDLSTSEVAARFSVSTRSVRKWCARGLFPNAFELQTQRGTEWVIPESDLNSFVPPKHGRPRTRKLINEATMTEKAA